MIRFFLLLLTVTTFTVGNAFVARHHSIIVPRKQSLPTAIFLQKQAENNINNNHKDASSSQQHVMGHPLSSFTKDTNKNLVLVIKKVVFDTLFAEDTTERSFARFWALETIARMPYFSYLTALHFYETIGWWRKSEYLQIHFAETWNEQHHLLIMEELGGDDLWFDRFVAQHIALGYFWMALVFYFINPVFAYNFNQAVEEEAFETYGRFLETHIEYLKSQPAPVVAKKYYGGEDPFSALNDSRPPAAMNTLYDCFAAIQHDEGEHAAIMIRLQGAMISSSAAATRDDEINPTIPLQGGTA